MENKVIHISFKEMVDIKKIFEDDNSLFIAEINGSNVQQIQDYFDSMSEIFSFPIPSRNFGGYSDWMEDLDWLNKDRYVLIIYNYIDFLSQDLSSKNSVINSFNEYILPWWEEDVEKYCVDGKAKAFNVYLVD